MSLCPKKDHFVLWTIYFCASLNSAFSWNMSFGKASWFSLPARFYFTTCIMQETIEIVNNCMSDFRCHCKDDIFLRKSLQTVCLTQSVKALVSGETFTKWHAYFWVHVIRSICRKCDNISLTRELCVWADMLPVNLRHHWIQITLVWHKLSEPLL